MKATEIVSKLRDVLLSSSEDEKVQDDILEDVKLEQETTEVEDEVQLQDNPEVEATEEVGAMEHKEMSYATKEELAEVKAMVEKIMGEMKASEETKQDVPQELSAVEQPITHSPENSTEKKNTFVYSQKGPQTTFDRVLARLNK